MRPRVALLRLTGAGLLAGLALAGCATPTPTTVTAAPPPPDVLALERVRVADLEAEAARRAAAAGRLHEALWRWRAVEAVARDPAPARAEVSALEGRISAEADRLVSRAEAARAPRDLAAVGLYEQALALDPHKAAALAYLRQVETTAVLAAVAQEQSAAAHKPRRKASPKLAGRPRG